LRQRRTGEVTGPSGGLIRMRNWGARVHEVVIGGIDAVVLENELLRVTVLAGKGTDVVELNAKRYDLDFAWRTDVGPGPSGDFFDRYEGGWQEVLPNGGAPGMHRGASFDQHDEVASLPWDWRVEADTEDEVSVRFSVQARRVPLRIEKTLRLRTGEGALSITEKLTNTSPVPVEAMWGHHITFGQPFAGPGCEIRLPVGTEVVPHPVAIDPSGRRRVSGAAGTWPKVDGVDLSVLPERGSPGDLVYLRGFGDVGSYEVVDPSCGLGMRVEWDATVLPWLWFWQEFGAWTDCPGYGRHYNIGLEPFSSYPTDGLAEAVTNGTALVVPPGGTVPLWLRAVVVEENG
jgi:hypothetical protein